MSQPPTDENLTSYLLGELPAHEAAAVEFALAADPALRAEMRELDQLRHQVGAALAPREFALLPHQREAIRRAARQAAAADLTIPMNFRRRSAKSWLVPLAAAAVVTLAALVFISKSGRTQLPQVSSTPATVSRIPDTPNPVASPLPEPASASSPASTPPPAVVAVAEEPAIIHSTVAATDGPTLALPVQAGHVSMESIRGSIRGERRLPPHDAVRLEEMLNNFALRPEGLTVVARHPTSTWHPDERGTGTTSHAATIATEVLTCPWKPSASLVLVSIRGNPFSDCEVTAVFRSDPALVRHCRLLGFAPTDGPPADPLPTRLPAKSITSLVLEIESATAAGDLGMIDWTVNGQAAPPLQLVRHNATEPSDDARFAALVCTFAQWLAADPAARIDEDVLAALTRETAAETMPAERADLLKLIAEALEL